MNLQGMGKFVPIREDFELPREISVAKYLKGNDKELGLKSSSYRVLTIVHPIQTRSSLLKTGRGQNGPSS